MVRMADQETSPEGGKTPVRGDPPRGRGHEVM